MLCLEIGMLSAAFLPTRARPLDHLNGLDPSSSLKRKGQFECRLIIFWPQRGGASRRGYFD
jgi:hypothetical protein